jgi:homoserine/homoserine lactone efflux protein
LQKNFLMSTELFLAFVLATAALALLPGPIVSLVVANGTSFGTRAALTTVAGSSTGLALLVTGAALGMGSLMALIADWFDYIRWAGAAYLAWLGASRLRRAWTGAEIEPVSMVKGKRWYWQGLVAALSNPKVLLFLGAFFPQFVSQDAAPGPQMAILAVTFVLTASLCDGLYAVVAGTAKSWFTDGRMRFADGFGGCLLICGGMWLALSRRA